MLSTGILTTSMVHAADDGGLPISNPGAPVEDILFANTDLAKINIATAIVAAFNGLKGVFEGFHKSIWPAGRFEQWFAPMQVRFTTAFVLKLIADSLSHMTTRDGGFIYLRRCIGYIFTFGLGAWFSVVMEQLARKYTDVLLLRLTGSVNPKLSYFAGGVIASGVLIAGGAYFVNEMAQAFTKAEADRNSTTSAGELRRLLSIVPQEVTTGGLVDVTTRSTNLAGITRASSDSRKPDGFRISTAATNWAGYTILISAFYWTDRYSSFSDAQLNTLPISFSNKELNRTQVVSLNHVKNKGLHG